MQTRYLELLQGLEHLTHTVSRAVYDTVSCQMYGILYLQISYCTKMYPFGTEV